MIQTIAVPITTTGADASGVGSVITEALYGELVDVFLDFHASAPATTDVTIAYTNRGGNILVVTNSATDALIAPRQALVTNANAAITDGHARYVLSGPLTISVAGSNALAPAVTVYLRVQR